MLYFLGNCQADFICRTMADRGFDCTHRVLASPLTYTSHPGEIPATLVSLDERMGLTDYMHGRDLKNQFQPIGPADAPPKLVVMSLFHENTPLFRLDDEDIIFFMDTQALTDKPGLMRWAQNNCRMFKPNPYTYLRRYGEMLARFRQDVPDVPIIILSRLSPFPAFGPDPFSYLDEWEAMYSESREVLKGWAASLDNVHILDMDRVFGGIWANSDTGIESLCPFLKIKLTEEDGQVTGLHARRDIEHIGPMPGRLADKVAAFLEEGVISYNKDEIVLPEWKRHWRLKKLTDTQILEKLCSGANYLGAEAVASFFLDLGRDYTPFLVQAREAMPVCHMTLHMIKAYGRIHANPELAVWCETHLETARTFTANGLVYQQSYMKRVEGIRQSVLS